MKIKNKNIFRIIPAATLTVVLCCPSVSQAQPSDPPVIDRNGHSRANVGLGAATRDDEVLDLLLRHNVTPRAVFMQTPGGFSGAHRNNDGQDAQTLIEEARAKTAESFENSLEGNLVRLRDLAETYTEEDIAANEDARNQARSLLIHRAAFEVSLAAAKNGSEKDLF